MSQRHDFDTETQIVLAAIAKEAGKTQDELSADIKAIVAGALRHAFNKGETRGRTMPTDPPPGTGGVYMFSRPTKLRLVHDDDDDGPPDDNTNKKGPPDDDDGAAQ